LLAVLARRSSFHPLLPTSILLHLLLAVLARRSFPLYLQHKASQLIYPRLSFSVWFTSISTLIRIFILVLFRVKWLSTNSLLGVTKMFWSNVDLLNLDIRLLDLPSRFHIDMTPFLLASSSCFNLLLLNRFRSTTGLRRGVVSVSLLLTSYLQLMAIYPAILPR
jgi:hypothetical protein